MVLFAIAYSIAEFVIVCIAIFQFFAALITGRVNEPLLRFGNNLSTYVYQVFRYQTFNSEVRPFPFTDWPDEPQTENDWLTQPEAAVTPAATPADPAPAADTVRDESESTNDSENNADDSGQRGDDDRVR